MAAEEACRRATESMCGKALTAVSYVGLRYGDTDVPWDFGDWHWPEVAVELVLSTGDVVHANLGLRSDELRTEACGGTVRRQKSRVDSIVGCI